MDVQLAAVKNVFRMANARNFGFYVYTHMDLASMFILRFCYSLTFMSIEYQ